MPGPALVLAPFRALRYDATRVADIATVTSPPYDVIDEAGVDRFLALHPNNVVRLILPRGPESGPGNRYALAAETMDDWRRSGVLVPESAPALYVYEEVDGGHVQRGLVGGLGLLPFDAGVVLPHENVMPGPVADRLALMTATEANLEPIFLVYDGGGAASDVVAAAAKNDPLIATTTDDGIAHRVWAITDREALEAIAADLAPRQAVIADGHHRYTTYLHLQDQRRAAGDGAGPWDFGLTLLVDTAAFGPEVHAIHRVLPGLAVDEAARRLEGSATVRRIDGGVDAGLGELARAGERGPAYLLVGGDDVLMVSDVDSGVIARSVPADRAAAWRDLDVTVAHHVLVPLWGLADTEASVGYAHDVGEAVALAAAAGGTALLLNPTPVDAVIAVARVGDRMPRKSTLFTPKPRTGLLIRAFADA